MSTIYYHHNDFLKHNTGSGHPESSDRLRIIDKTLNASVFASLTKVKPTLTDTVKNKIELVHPRSYIESILNAVPKEGTFHLDNDTVLSPGTGKAAMMAVAAVCDAVDKVITKQFNNAFCAVRPPGHHAEPNHAMGFCLFNNVAIAAEYARNHHHIKRVAIIDFDVHHGNGTQTTFFSKPDVFYASTHEMPNYPGTGYPSETGAGNIINAPLKPGSSGSEFRKKYTDIIFPALIKFNPGLILVSAGFDAHQADPLSSINLNEEDYAWITRELLNIANKCCSGRIISTLEGGYDLEALGRSVANHVHTLIDG